MEGRGRGSHQLQRAPPPPHVVLRHTGQLGTMTVCVGPPFGQSLALTSHESQLRGTPAPVVRAPGSAGLEEAAGGRIEVTPITLGRRTPPAPNRRPEAPEARAGGKSRRPGSATRVGPSQPAEEGQRQWTAATVNIPRSTRVNPKTPRRPGCECRFMRLHRQGTE